MRFHYLAAFTALTTLAATPAFGLSPQVFVSGKGADAAGCGTTLAPCRTFQYALDSAVAPGGVISVMDSGDYGSMVIRKSVSVINNGAGVASIGANGQPTAIEINIPAFSRVVLRGLTVDGGRKQNYGLFVRNVASLDISNCVFRNFVVDGVILVDPVNTFFDISDTEASDNGRSGLFISATSAKISGVVRNSRFNRNATGVIGAIADKEVNYPEISVVVKNVEVNGGQRGFYITAANRASMMLTGVNVTGVRDALSTSMAGKFQLARSNLTNNGFAFDGTGRLTTFGDNQLSLTSPPPPQSTTLVPMK